MTTWVIQFYSSHDWLTCGQGLPPEVWEGWQVLDRVGEPWDHWEGQSLRPCGLGEKIGKFRFSYFNVAPCCEQRSDTRSSAWQAGPYDPRSHWHRPMSSSCSPLQAWRTLAMKTHWDDIWNNNQTHTRTHTHTRISIYDADTDYI